jgi:hypothetical protein
MLQNHDHWSNVLEQSRNGNLEAMRAVGHTQEADKHPVCVKLLAFIGLSKRGSDIRDHFDAPPYGWPRDAIDGALYALLPPGHIKATDASNRACRCESFGPCSLDSGHIPARIHHYHTSAADQDQAVV